MTDDRAAQNDKKNSVEKALTILMAFVPHNRMLGSSELSKLLGLSTSTVNRLLHNLVSFDLVKQDPISRKFSLGKGAFELGCAINKSMPLDLVNIARPYCDQLRDATGETVGLEIWSNDSSIQAYNAPSFSPISVLNTLGKLGEKYPLHVSAGAKAILAYSSQELIDRLIQGNLKRFTPNTLVEPDELKKHLQEVKKTGIAIDNGEFNIEVYAISAPIFDAGKKPVAAVVIAAPFYRAQMLQQPNTIASLHKAVSSISKELFYSEEEEIREG